MSSKMYALAFLFFISAIGYSENLIPELFIKNESPVLQELFTLNIGVMKLKNSGKITAINPLDSDNAVNAIKNTLDTVTSAGLSKKDSVYKAIMNLKSKLSDTDKNSLDILERKILYSSENVDNSYIYQTFLEFQKNSVYKEVSKKWFENYANPFYLLKTKDPFDRVFYDDKMICEANSVDKKPLDFLFSGEIERIDNRYFVTVYIYSYLKNKVISGFSVVTDSDNLSSKVNEKMEQLIPEIFLIQYADVVINTEDENTSIYLDAYFIGKKNVEIKFLLPKKYVITLKKENYEDKSDNIELAGNEKKFVFLQIDRMKELQMINFYIEPLGTKIFINSVYQGKTPFKKALPSGDYIISSKSELFDNSRYFLSIREISTEEKTVVFHLKSKDIKTNYDLKRTLYYTSFWNFSFSFATAIAFTVVAIEYRVRAPFSNDLINTYNALYGLAWGFSAYTVISLGWLFFALADYLFTKEKNDFIPILEFYKNSEGDDMISMGATIRL